MKVYVKFLAVDIPYNMENPTFDLPDGSNVETVMDECLKLPEVNIEEDYFKASMVLKNGKRAELGEEVKDGDVLTVLRTMEGG